LNNIDSRKKIDLGKSWLHLSSEKIKFKRIIDFSLWGGKGKKGVLVDQTQIPRQINDWESKAYLKNEWGETILKKINWMDIEEIIADKILYFLTFCLWERRKNFSGNNYISP